MKKVPEQGMQQAIDKSDMYHSKQKGVYILQACVEENQEIHGQSRD